MIPLHRGTLSLIFLKEGYPLFMISVYRTQTAAPTSSLKGLVEKERHNLAYVEMRERHNLLD
jgi:hypothetical protein